MFNNWLWEQGEACFVAFVEFCDVKTPTNHLTNLVNIVSNALQILSQEPELSSLFLQLLFLESPIQRREIKSLSVKTAKKPQKYLSAGKC